MNNIFFNLLDANTKDIFSNINNISEVIHTDNNKDNLNKKNFYDTNIILIEN